MLKRLIYWYYNNICIKDLKDINDEHIKNKYPIDEIIKYYKQRKIWMLYEWLKEYEKFWLNKPWPKIIYYVWNVEILKNKVIWIVWPRKCSKYWEITTKKLIKKFEWKKWITTVSWMADWIDKICHIESINCKISTIAVLWWWLMYYLSSKEKYFIDKIINNWWLVLSEYKLNTKPERYTFPQRNKIIAWLSDLIILPEAWEKSWSLITIDYWIKFNKKIYWVCWRIENNNSKWVNKLICEWKIRWIYDIDKVFDKEFWIKKSILEKTEELSEMKIKILEQLNKKWEISIDHISKQAEINLQDCIIEITELIEKWLIIETYPWIYSIV